MAQQEFFAKPKFSHLIEPDDCLTAPRDVILLDMYTLQVKDLEVECVGLFMGVWVCTIPYKSFIINITAV